MDEVGDVEESPWLSFQRETAMLAARSKTFETIDRMREQGIQRERTYFSPYTIDLSTNPGFLKDLTEFERQNVTGISEIVKAERLQATVRTWEDRTPVLYCCPRCYGLFGYLPDLRPHFQKCIGKYENPEGLKWSDMWVMPVKYERPKPYMKWLVDCNEEKKRAHGSYGNDATAAR